MKTVILFYSRTRKTALVAKTLSNAVGADLVEVTDLTDRMGPLNYFRSALDAVRENKTRIKPEKIDLSDYGLVYIGGPTWASKPAPAIITLIDHCDLQGKDVIPFTTVGRNGGGQATFTTMGNRGARQVINRMREKIEARGGRMVNSIIIRTGGYTDLEIEEEARKTVQELDLALYGI
ncbi:MAG: flavodoxin [Methanobacteriaceae archaeon]